MAIDHDKWAREIGWSVKSIRGWERVIRAIIADSDNAERNSPAKHIAAEQPPICDVPDWFVAAVSTDEDATHSFQFAREKARPLWQRVEAEIARRVAELEKLVESRDEIAQRNQGLRKHNSELQDEIGRLKAELTHYQNLYRAGAKPAPSLENLRDTDAELDAAIEAHKKSKETSDEVS